MKRKMLVCAFFIAISGHIYSQEKSSKVSEKSGSGGSRRRALSQNSHFNQPETITTNGNGTSYLRKKYLHIMNRENEGFARRGTFFKKKKENNGFATNGYKYKPNRKKGIR
jgi:hypothetical protein